MLSPTAVLSRVLHKDQSQKHCRHCGESFTTVNCPKCLLKKLYACGMCEDVGLVEKDGPVPHTVKCPACQPGPAYEPT